MTEKAIETILGRAPQPRPPAYLLERLHADIRLPQQMAYTRKTTQDSWPLFRWKSALGFGAFLLSCVLVVGVQSSRLSRLNQQNSELRATTAGLAELRQRAADAARVRARMEDLEQLRKDNQDLQRLRSELEPMREWPNEIQRLRRENERLLNALSTSGTATPEDRFFEDATKNVEERGCIENLKQFGIAIRVWALDNDGRMPTSVIEMSNELSKVSCLICPSDKSKESFGLLSWSEFQPEMSSYQFYLTGEKDFGKYADAIISKCPLHHLYGLADGSVQKVNPAYFSEVKKDGRWYLKRKGDLRGGTQP